MIKHVVCFKLKEPTETELWRAKEVLMSMKGNVPMMRDIFVGIDELHSARSFDIILEVILDDMDALDAYQNDPYHVGVVKTHMHKVAEKSIALDCEL